MSGAYTHWTDAQLIAYEQDLYDREVDGENTWADRDEVLWEMNRRNLCGRSDALPKSLLERLGKLS